MKWADLVFNVGGYMLSIGFGLAVIGIIVCMFASCFGRW